MKKIVSLVLCVFMLITSVFTAAIADSSIAGVWNAISAESEGMTMDKDMLDSVAVQELVDLICELPEIYRDVLELRAYHGLSEKQIAAILDVEYATVRKRLERARTMLAEKMKQQEGEVYEHL